jgi:hypothetical protein
MASGWQAVRDELNLVMEGAPFSFRRIKGGVADVGGFPVPQAGSPLFNEGYFIIPRSVAFGERMELLSVEREMLFDIYMGTTLGSDFDVESEALVDKIEQLIQKLMDCNANIPSARQVKIVAPVTVNYVQETPSQVYVVAPCHAFYRMP